MNKLLTQKGKFLVALLALCLACGPLFAATSATKQLEKGKQLYAANKDDEAMDAFIDVLVNGSRAEVEEANKYINLIHSRIGGIQDPVEVDVNFKEGAERRLQPAQDPAVLQEQLAAEQAALEQDLAEEGLIAPAQVEIDEEEIARQQALLEQQAQQRALEMQQQAIQAQRAAAEAAAKEEEAKQEAAASSTFMDLTSPSALKARQLYTSQKLDSMKEAAIAKLEKTKGVRVYFRNGLPDAVDIDSEVLFDGTKFRTDAQPVLDQLYTLMALTQGAGYIILPPGSYTDNITLSGIRQAMALNSFLVHKGLSSGKLSYNMGLFDQEPPAKFANLDGVSVVFDFDADLPAALPDAASVSKLPMLSMAVVPVSNKIDPSAGEAFVIDFSVIETVNAIDNWLFQVIQQGANDTYYVVRQLEGFAPVYHQLMWNGRKGIIGPELDCGKYTFVLTAADVQGGKHTLRRQVEVACTSTKKTAAKTDVSKATTSAQSLNYKTPRLWTKPGRDMKMAVQPVYTEPEAVNPLDTPTYPDTSSTSTNDQLLQPTTTQGVSNPYDMPFEEYGN